MPIVIPAALIAALALATTWWQTVVALIAIAAYILSMSGIHHCRGYFYANKEGRKTIILMLVNLGSNPAEIVSKSLTVTNAWFDPYVRYLRWRWGILTKQRRNSCVHGVRTRGAPRSQTSHREGDAAIWGYNDYCRTAYLAYLGSGLVTEGVSYAQLLIGLGVVQVTKGSFVDGSVLQDTKAMQLGLGISMDYVITNSNIILILFHLVLGDPQLRYFLLLMPRVRIYMLLVRKSLSSRRRGASMAASGSWRHSYRRVSSSYLLRPPRTCGRSRWNSWPPSSGRMRPKLGG